MEPCIELGGLALDGGSLIVTGDEQGHVQFHLLRLGEHTQLRTLTRAVRAGMRVMRVVRTDHPTSLTVPVSSTPAPPALWGESSTPVAMAPYDAETIMLHEWRWDSGEPSWVIWAGYGPRTRTWAVRTGGPLTGAP